MLENKARSHQTLVRLNKAQLVLIDSLRHNSQGVLCFLQFQEIRAF